MYTQAGKGDCPAHCKVGHINTVSPVAVNIWGFLPHLRSFCSQVKDTNLSIYNGCYKQ